MNDAMTDEAPLTAARVGAWLRQHPDFLNDHPELLSQLQVSHESGGAVSLIERQVQQLRRRNEELEERLQELTGVASANDALFARLRQLILALMDHDTIEGLGDHLKRELHDSFHCDQVALLCFTPAVPEPWRHVNALAFEQQLPGLTRNHRALAGKWRRDELRFLFGEPGLALSSAAVIPLLDNDMPRGIIALGSHEASHFRSSMDTLLITHLGDIVARLLGLLARQTADPFEP